MKTLSARLYRALMFVLGLIAPASALYLPLLSNYWIGVIWLCVQTFLAALLTFLPAFIGNYQEYEVIHYEGGNTGDPNPDRETRRERIHEGYRFPLRLTIDLVFLVGNFLLLLFVKHSLFAEMNVFYRVGFMILQIVLMMLAMNHLASSQCLWLDIPGVVIGAIGYLGMAIYLHYSKAPANLTIFFTVLTVVYLFLGTVTLNRQSIAMSMATHAGDTPRAPRQIARKNKRIVLSFATAVTVLSLVDALRNAILWVVARMGDVAMFLLHILGINPGAGGDELPAALTGEMGEVAGETASVVIEEISDPGLSSYIIVYGFLGFVGIGALVLIFEAIRKMVKKLSKWMEKFATGINEGFYDEREQLMSAEEMRERLKNDMKARLKALFTREPSWESLSGRDRARRLMRDFYKKRTRKVQNLRVLTAREALKAAESAEQKRFGELYDRARYSEHEVDAAEADQLKKNLKL